MQKARNFTEGRILSPLIRFAFPVLAALILQAAYGAVDLMIVGWFGSSADVSAVSTGSQLMHTVTAVIVGLAMGITVLAGQKIGQKRPDEAGDAIGSGIALFTVVTVILTAAMLILSRPFTEALKAPAEAFDQTVAYVRICASGTAFIVAYNVLGSIFRGIGDSKMPLITVAIASILNVLGDLLFVAGFGMGAAGAAWATVLAQGFSVLLSLVFIRRRALPFDFSVKRIRFNGKVIRSILVLGTPIALQDLLVSISFLVIMAIVNSLGLVASAGVGVAQKLCTFIMLVPSAYMQSMSAFVAQNIGAHRIDRARKALFYGIASSFAISIPVCYFSCFHGEILAGLFVRRSEVEVIAAAADYLKAYGIDTLFTSFLFCFLGYFNGCGNTLFVLLQGIAGAFCVRVPVSYFVSRTAGATLFHIGLATPASTVVQIVLCFICLYWQNRRIARGMGLRGDFRLKNNAPM